MSAETRLRRYRSAVLAIGRLTHDHPDLNRERYEDDWAVKMPPAPAQRANVVSSLLTNGKHAPAIDVDVPMHLVPSSTPGHSHLYIDVEMTWEEYLRLLRVLVDVGVVEPGFLASADRRGTTLLRLPGVQKD